MPDGGADLGNFQRDAAARIARTRQGQAPRERQRPAVDLQKGAGIVLEKPDQELRAVGTVIALEGLRQRRRRDNCHNDYYRPEN